MCEPSGPWYSGRAAAAPTPTCGSPTRAQPVAEALSQHYSEGRLDANELKERLDQAIGAKTRRDLSGLMTDLPRCGRRRPNRTGTAVTWPCGPRLFVLVAAVAFPWWPFHWFWFPRVPWVLFGIVGLLVCSRLRRHRRAHGPTY